MYLSRYFSVCGIYRHGHTYYSQLLWHDSSQVQHFRSHSPKVPQSQWFWSPVEVPSGTLTILAFLLPNSIPGASPWFIIGRISSWNLQWSWPSTVQSAPRLLAAADYLCQVGTGGACAVISWLPRDGVKVVATGTVRGARMFVMGLAWPWLFPEQLLLLFQMRGERWSLFVTHWGYWHWSSVSVLAATALWHPEASCTSPTMTHVLLNFLKVAVTMHLP